MGMDGLIRVLEYRGLVKRMVGKVKYRLVVDMVDEVVETVVSLGELEPLAREKWLVVAVPLHKNRLRWRGFNQADELARRLAKYGGWEYGEGVLVRRVDTKPQVGLSAVQRRKNVVGAFGVRSKRVCGNILLVDDVWTTGATMRECAKVLKRAGVAKVWGLVVAG